MKEPGKAASTTSIRSIGAEQLTASYTAVGVKYSNGWNGNTNHAAEIIRRVRAIEEDGRCSCRHRLLSKEQRDHEKGGESRHASKSTRRQQQRHGTISCALALTSHLDEPHDGKLDPQDKQQNHKISYHSSVLKGHVRVSADVQAQRAHIKLERLVRILTLNEYRGERDAVDLRNGRNRWNGQGADCRDDLT